MASAFDGASFQSTVSIEDTCAGLFEDCPLDDDFSLGGVKVGGGVEAAPVMPWDAAAEPFKVQDLLTTRASVQSTASTEQPASFLSLCSEGVSFASSLGGYSAEEPGVSFSSSFGGGSFGTAQTPLEIASLALGVQDDASEKPFDLKFSSRLATRAAALCGGDKGATKTSKTTMPPPPPPTFAPTVQQLDQAAAMTSFLPPKPASFSGPFSAPPGLEDTVVPPPPPPVAEQERLPSRGARLHAFGECVPCKFFRGHRGCKDGENCKLCHMPHEELTYSGIRRTMRKKGLERRQMSSIPESASGGFVVPALGVPMPANTGMVHYGSF